MKRPVAVFLLLLFSAAAYCQSDAKAENLRVFWPKDQNWKIVDGDKRRHVDWVASIPGNEKKKSRTILGTELKFRKVVISNYKDAVDYFRSSFSKGPVKANVKILSVDTTSGSYKVIFKMEYVFFEKDPKMHAALTYITQGKTNLLAVMVEIKEPVLSAEFIESWSAVLKKSAVYYDY